MTTYYFDVDVVLADFHTNYIHAERERFITYDYIRNLQPFEDNVRTVHLFTSLSANVYIATRVANEDCARARREWLHEYLPEIDDSHIIIAINGSLKPEMLPTADGIFINDLEKECKKFAKRGFTPIWIEEKGSNILETPVM